MKFKLASLYPYRNCRKSSSWIIGYVSNVINSDKRVSLNALLDIKRRFIPHVAFSDRVSPVTQRLSNLSMNSINWCLVGKYVFRNVVPVAIHTYSYTVSLIPASRPLERTLNERNTSQDVRDLREESRCVYIRFAFICHHRTAERHRTLSFLS